MSLSHPATFGAYSGAGQVNGELNLRQHVLDLDDLLPSEIASVLENTRSMKEVLKRDIKKVPTLRGRVVVTLFYEASTRTRISF